MTAEDFRAEFALRKRRQRNAATAFVAALVAVAVVGSALRVPAEYWMPVLGAIGVAAVLFSVSNWKCPACGAALSTRSRSDSCPECDARLED